MYNIHIHIYICLKSTLGINGPSRMVRYQVLGVHGPSKSPESRNIALKSYRGSCDNVRSMP